MKRAVVIAVVGSFVAIVGACKRGGGEHSCAVDPAAGCICANEPFQLGPGQKPTQDCAPPAEPAPWRCCHDVDSQGETKSCACERGSCRKSDRGWCGCEWNSAVGTGYTAMSTCEPASGQKCCQRNDGGNCICDVWQTCPSDAKQVDRCVPSTLKPGACSNPGPHESKTCDGLKWKKSKS